MWALLSVFCLLSVFMESTSHTSCSFNPLCTCSKPGPDLGDVICHDVPMIRTPDVFNGTIIYTLSLQRNGLRHVSKECFSGTRMWSLTVRHNSVTQLLPGTLSGMERDLRQIDLSWNTLYRVPQEALEDLKKLQFLDLTGNKVNQVHEDDFRKIGKTLRKLILAGNSLTVVDRNSFKNLEVIEVLDLSSNSIFEIHNQAFPVPAPFLNNLSLADNLLDHVPFPALQNMMHLTYLELSGNSISTLKNPSSPLKLSLSELHLERNSIETLEEDFFQNFRKANNTYLVGNPISEIEANAFRLVTIASLDLGDCQIWRIHDRAFSGLETSLKSLDLSYNNLTLFPEVALGVLQSLESLSLKGNRKLDINIDSFQNLKFRLSSLDLSEIETHIPIPQDAEAVRELQDLNLGGQRFQSLNENVLDQFGRKLEDVRLVDCSIKNIDEFAFESCSSLKRLDLSDNSIEDIHSSAFKNVEQSLRRLTIQHGLSMVTFPSDALCGLKELTHLDFSYNFFLELPDDNEECMEQLQWINLNHNSIKVLKPLYFRQERHPNIQDIRLSFNRIERLESDSFSGLSKLKTLKLNNNRIRTIATAAFRNLDSLIFLNLEGNYITTLVSETFQNLPQLQFLHLSYNTLKDLNLNSLDHVGRATSLTVSAGHNNLSSLSRGEDSWDIHVTLKNLDVNHNNISILDSWYFKSISDSLQFLDLSFNNISVLNSSHLLFPKRLQQLDLSNNVIHTLTGDTFLELGSLQILNLSRNDLIELPQELFRQNENIRVLDFSSNKIGNLPDDLLKETQLEQCMLGSNDLHHFPVSALALVNKTLLHLDLSRNKLRYLSGSDLKFSENLIHLDVSKNRITSLNGEATQQLKNLVSLDLSNNAIHKLNGPYLHLSTSIEELNIAGTQQSSLPSLYLPNVIKLNLSNNAFLKLETQKLSNMKELRELDLSGNKIVELKNDTWNFCPQLQKLVLSNISITNLTNGSFAGLNYLEELELTDLKVSSVQPGVLLPLKALRSLTIETSEAPNFQKVILKNHSLRTLRIRARRGSDLNGIFRDRLPKSLNFLDIEGAEMKDLNSGILDNLRSREIHLRLVDTNTTWLPQTFFQRMGKVHSLHLDLRNNKFRLIPDVVGVNAREKVGPKLRLKRILLSGNEWHCNCNLAWLDKWFRTQYNERQQQEKPTDDRLQEILHDMRNTVCLNKSNRSILEVFKTDLNCLRSQQLSGAPRTAHVSMFRNALLTLTLCSLRFTLLKTNY